ncbi:hypothetical protein PFAS1_23495 [Pseudomonas frederiksbergensis]|nr:hypothetical protein PFAS1_23495 [Pseudomonas frederiksbergensis]
MFSAAQASRQSLETTASVFQRVAQNGKQLGLSFADVASITETIAKSVALSGASAQAAEAALTQFGQALASGALRGDELNSIMEQTPALAQTIARGLGVSVGQLRAMGAEGELTSEKLIKALTGQKAAVDELATTMQVTGSQALTAFGNSLTQAIGKLDEAAGASNKFAGAILSMSRALDGFSSGEFSDFFRDNKETVAGLNSEIGTTLSRMRDLNTARAKLNPNDAGDTVLFNFKFYNRDELDREIAGLSKRADEARSTIEKMKKDAAGVSGQSPKGDAAGASAVNEAYEKQLKSLQKMAALQGDNTEVAKTRYAIEHGELGKLLPAQEELLLKYAREKDAKAASEAAVKKYGSAAEKAANQEKKALDSLLAQSAISTNSTNAMADAYLAGADNVRELTIQQKIEEELLKTGAGARDAVTAAVNREADAKDRLDIDQSIASMRIETTQTLAQATATLQGKTALEAFNIQKSMTVALAGKNIEYGSEEYQLLLDQTKAQLDANKALEQAGQVEGIVDRLNPQIKLLKDYTAEQDALNAAIARYPENAALYQDALAKLGREYEVNQSKATIWGQLTEGAIDRIDGVFADAWANIGSGANNLWDSLVKGAKQAFGEIAHMLTTKPLLASISNWLTGTDNGQGLSSVWGKLLGGATGQQGGSGGMSGMGSNLVSMGKSIYQAYSAITGVGAEVVSGYASGGVSGAIQGGASYYGNMLSNISSTLSNGFTSLVSTFTGATAVQTAAIIGAEGVTSAALTGAVTEGAAAVGAQFTTGVATTSAATYAAAEAGAAATAASLGGQISAAVSSMAAMWPLAVVMGMYQSGKLYDSGVRPDAGEIMDSGGKTALGKVAMAPGAAMSGFFEAQDKALSKVVGGKWAAILSGSTLHQAVTKYVGEKLFGGSWQTKNSGITLGVENGQLEGQQFIDQKKKGGLFSSSKKRTRYSALDAQTAESLSAVYDATEQGVIALVSRIGISANEGTFDGLNIAQSKLSTKGKTGEEVQKLVSDWFSSASDQMVGFLDGGTGGFGYSFAELAQRIASFETFNGTLDTLNIAVLGLSPHSMELANSLIAAAGGMEAFQTATNTYYDNFFSEAEKADDTLSAITKQFAGMGVTLPGTRDAYRGMVEALDMTTASGQSMFMTLTGLAGNAAQAYSILEQRAGAAAEATAAAAAAAKELADALKEALMGSVSSAMSAVQRAVSAEKDASTKAYNARITSLNDMVSTATENVSGLTAVGNDLSAALKALRGDSDDAVKMLRAQAQATLQSALATAKAGGSLSGVTGLEDALDTVSNNNTDLYGSLEDFARDQGRTANVVAELNGINGKQLTTAEKSLEGLETQIELAKAAYDAQMAQFDQQLAFAQAQMDALNGIDSSVISVSAAISAMNASVVAALSAISGPATGATSTNNETLVESLYNSVLGRKSEAEGKANWVAWLKSGAVTYDQLFAGFTGSDEYKQKKAAGVPGFAAGGNFGGGLRLVGERGPELEVTGPSRIYNANQTAAMLSGGSNNASVVAELRAVRAELESIKANTQASAQSGGKLVRTIDRVTDGGNAMLTQELA